MFPAFCFEREELTHHFPSPGRVAVLQRGPGARPDWLWLLAEGGQRVQHGPVRPGTDGGRAGPAQQQNTGGRTVLNILYSNILCPTPDAPHLKVIGRRRGGGWGRGILAHSQTHRFVLGSVCREPIRRVPSWRGRNRGAIRSGREEDRRRSGDRGDEGGVM